MNNRVLVRVALPIALDQIFTYSIDFYGDKYDLIGRRANVVLSNKSIIGVIVGLDEAINHEYKILEVSELLDESPIFGQNLMKLISWISNYYISPIGEAFKAALPQGMAKNPSQILVSITDKLPDNLIIFKNSPKRKSIYEFLANCSSPVSLDYIKNKLKIAHVNKFIEPLKNAGLIKIEYVPKKQIKPKYLNYISMNSNFFSNSEIISSTIQLLGKKSNRQIELINLLKLKYDSGKAEYFINDISDKYAINIYKSLEKKEIIHIEKREYFRNMQSNRDGSLAKRNEFELPLTEEQQSATGAVIYAINESKFKTFLLFGVTGSGKTLVYLHAINHCIMQGKSAILLVPEISLTPQLIDRFEKVFPDEIAVFHSRMSDGERFDAWRAASSGKAKIVIGARSGVFAPLNNLGLIIIDEEHETSYKQDSPNPRYNGRDSAIMRGYYENAVVLLGSATPSFESLYNAEIGRYGFLKITKRADGAAMPIIRSIDTISASKSGQMHGSFSKDMLDAIVDRISKCEGVILFQNRRGWASFLECPDCADVPICKHCAVTLVYHRAINTLRCHYCGYSKKAHYACTSCGHPALREIGSGTERLENELTDYFNLQNIEVKIERMDLDTTSGKGSHRAMLQRFATGKTDILIGTQMVAKGLDFDRVTLVGVVNADISLFLPDFRSSERTLQLLSQVSGRAGRSGEKIGEVLIQTAHPNDPAIMHTLANNFLDYYDKEIVFRKNAIYPPFSRFCIIEFLCEDKNKVVEASKFFADLLPRKQAYIILGPIAPSISKLKGKERRIIIIKNIKQYDSNGSVLRGILKSALKEYAKQSISGVRIIVDIDSYSNI